MSRYERRAKFVCDAARLHAIQLGCPVIPQAWDNRDEEFKVQFRKLISDLCSGKREFQFFEEIHEAWVDKYHEMGWRYGKEYDPVNKTHPDLVPYDELDPKEKIKDEVFVKLVDIARECIW